jgi:transcriptional regulator with XRE-family HTH domain
VDVVLPLPPATAAEPPPATLKRLSEFLYQNVYTRLQVELSVLIRHARHAAGITQLEVAQRAGTAQPAVAAYESGARAPSLTTLVRLLSACEHDVELVTHPRMRRGAASLAELSQTIQRDLEDDREQDALRLLFGFADDFRGSSRPGAIELIADEPATTGELRFDAMLAGVAEFFAAERGIPTPGWVNQPNRFVEPLWFVSSRPEFHAYTLANTPATFTRHGVLVAREVFDRA